MLHAEGHLAWLGRHSQLFKERAKIRVGDFVEDDESGVDRNIKAILLDGHRIGVAAGPMIALEECEICDAS